MAAPASVSTCTSSVWLVVVAVMLFVVSSVKGRCLDTKGPICPNRCTCYTTKINCSNSGLSQIPAELPSTVIWLLLDNNHIEHLSVTDLAGCNTLKTLNLSFNRLSSIDKAAFVDTLKLTSLDLSSNNITVDQLANETFDNLRSLFQLRLQNNSWPYGRHYHGRLFSKLINLQILHLDGLPNQSFPVEFSQLKNLKCLSIAGGLNKITNETFAAFKRSPVSNLTIRTGSHLVAVEPLSFAHFRHMKKLYLNKNRFLGFENVAKAWYGLQMTNINFMSLSSITTANDKQPQRITSSFFRYLNMTKIEVLILSHNDLELIEPLFSTNLPYLTKISVAGNRLYKPMELIADFAKLEHLKSVEASFQYCPSTPLTGIQLANTMDYNGINKFMKFYQLANDLDVSRCDTYEKQECNPSCHASQNTQSMQLNTMGESMCPICIPLPPNLTTLLVNDGLFVYRQTLPPLTITEGGGKLQLIQLGNNGLSDINGPIIFTNPPQNLAVSLSFNQIVCLHSDVFKISYEKGAKITELHLTANNLGLQLEQDIDGSTFRYYPFLRVLLLNYNAIKQLHRESFRNLTKMQRLTLSGNSLNNIDFEFIHMRELKLLDLSYNDLTFLSEAMMEKLSIFIAKNRYFSLALSGNPLQCTCDTLPFLRWMNRYRGNMYHFEANSCFFSGQYVNFSRLTDSILVELEFACSKSIAVVVSGTLVGLVLILATLSAVCYRNRWEIRYAFIKLTQRGQRYQQLVTKTVHHDYDAFVVYDSADRNWVNNELLPHLEQNSAASANREQLSGLCEFAHGSCAGLRFCVHERDFKPGEDIIGNIWNRMERSRKVILVISKTFAKSQYCDYEMNLARMQSVEIGRNVIVPILLGMPDIDEITDCLYWVLRKVTYLEWPQGEEEQSRFWQKLRRTITDDDDDSD